MKLSEMSWDEAVRRCKGKIILVPHGSTEEHGYHLHIDNDSFLAWRFCSEFNSSRNVVVAPVMNYTYMDLTKKLPGTVGLNEKEYEQMLESMIADFLQLKPKRIVFFMGHDARKPAEIFKKLSKKFRKVSAFHLRNILLDFARRGIIESSGTHAGEAETSLILYLEPKRVNMRKAAEDYWDNGKVSKSGVNGNPLKANKAKGKKIFDSIMKELRNKLK